MHMTARRAAAEGGFTLVLVVMVMLAAMGFGVAAYAAAGGDVQLTQRTTNAKRAYAGAEAGLAFYLQKLAQDNEYWTKCDKGDPVGTNPRSPVNQPRTGATETRQWRALPTDPQVEFTVELLPVAPATACVPGDDKTMLADDGTLKIRTSGKVGPAGRQVRRSIITSLRRKGFLDYLYFSDYETSDPLQQVLSSPNNLWYSSEVSLKRAVSQADAVSGGVPTSIQSWADQPSTCRSYAPGRNAVRFAPADTNGRFGYGYFDPDGSGSRPTGWYRTDDNAYGGSAIDIRCSTIQFAEIDDVRGPFHSNDTILVCGRPEFGRRDAVDDVEYFGYQASCAGGAPDLGPSQEMTDANGLHINRTFPDSNNELRASVENEYRFSGKTTIVLQGTQMQVTSGGTTTTKPLPPNGLVYVSDNGSAGACPPLDPRYPYATRDACGDAYVSGTYAKNLSIGTEGDVVVTGDLTMTGGNSLLGLIALNFVRVAHPMASYPCSSSTGNAAGTGYDRRIEAAILSVHHVFTVDNYQCGPKLGNLTVKGAIAQRYRGPVGTGGGSSGTGYGKDYQYDQRLKFRSPPFFLAPAQASWRVLRSTEQSPAT